MPAPPHELPERFVGLWQRTHLEEPRGTVRDSLERDGSSVFWLQHASGWYVDVRRVHCESRPRAFAGTCSHALDAASGRDILTWTRYMDTRPELLPSGVDAAAAELSADGRTLVEDGGDAYLERWRRIDTGSSSKPAFVGEPPHAARVCLSLAGAVAHARVEECASERQPLGAPPLLEVEYRAEGGAAELFFRSDGSPSA